MIERFIIGKYYRYTNTFGPLWWSEERKKVLTGKPFKCTGSSYGDCAKFEGIKLSFDWKEDIEFWEEVNMEEITPKKGDTVLVWNGDRYAPVKRIYLKYKQDTSYPHMCVSSGDEQAYLNEEDYNATPWKYMKPLPKTAETLKRGDWVKAWDNDVMQTRTQGVIFLAYIEHSCEPYVCVTKDSTDDFLNGRSFSTANWEHAAPIEMVTISVTPNQLQKIKKAGIL